ncbi:MAG: hypothetical protein IJ014_05855 [Rikenellaceae bacterium]|nr:hypothetical protein [Rikenellaceae bacterium]
MSKIEQAKAYTGNDLENIFFRPILTGPNAEQLGIRVLYNMPVPTTLNFWRRSGDVLQKFTSGGWSGSAASEKFQKNIAMTRVKAEVGYSAADYFSLVYEQISARPDVNMQDLSGTELEQAETSLFKEAIAESIRATMWMGNSERAGKFNTFDGFIKQINTDSKVDPDLAATTYTASDLNQASAAEILFDEVWTNASEALRSLKSEGNLALFVTSDIYSLYENSLDSAALDAAYMARQNGRAELMWRGIPVVDMRISEYLKDVIDLPKSLIILTDRRNLALAVNTADFPGTEVSMWYNPDLMENRQRAVFMAGCDYLLPELVSYACQE